MRMSAERRVPASQQAVWEALNDPDVLRRSIPGCESVERIGDNEFAAAVTAKVGPVKARFQGRIVLGDIDPPRGYRLTGEGQGGAAGFAKGNATVTLEPDGDATLLKYDVEATVGGKLAQVGSRLVDAAARKFADDFFSRFNDIVSIGAAPLSEFVPETAPEPASETASAPGRGLPTAVWAAGLIVVVGLLLFLFS
jgi:carbon monoxide dehydrogenase subunit G